MVIRGEAFTSFRVVNGKSFCRISLPQVVSPCPRSNTHQVQIKHISQLPLLIIFSFPPLQHREPNIWRIVLSSLCSVRASPDSQPPPSLTVSHLPSLSCKLRLFLNTSNFFNHLGSSTSFNYLWPPLPRAQIQVCPCHFVLSLSCSLSLPGCQQNGTVFLLWSGTIFTLLW